VDDAGVMQKQRGPFEVAIHPLRHADEVEACAKLMAGSEPWITLRRTHRDAAKLLQDPDKENYIAQVNDDVVGFVILDTCGPFAGYVQSIGVMPDWRNRGIGSKLIAFAEARIFRESPNVFLCVSSFNAQAQKLYMRLGYERIGELKDYVVLGHSEILMRKTIGPRYEFRPPS
jgi:ribosomal protein S18 acetylase RimI-like enzyme